MSMLWRTHDHHRDVRALASAPRTTALHSTNREKSAVSSRLQHPHCDQRSSSRHPSSATPPSPISPVIPTGNAIRCSDNLHGSHHVPLPVVTSPRSAENRNTHRPSSATRGFVPRRLSYAWRRPKLFTNAKWQQSGAHQRIADAQTMQSSTAIDPLWLRHLNGPHLQSGHQRLHPADGAAFTV